MKYYRLIFIFGIWIIIVPFLGLPLIAKKILLIVPGAVMVLMGILMSQEYHHGAANAGISYRESNPDDKVVTRATYDEQKSALNDSDSPLDDEMYESHVLRDSSQEELS